MVGAGTAACAVGYSAGGFATATANATTRRWHLFVLRTTQFMRGSQYTGKRFNQVPRQLFSNPRFYTFQFPVLLRDGWVYMTSDC